MDSVSSPSVCVFLSFLFFFFAHWEARFDKKVVCQWVPYTVHGTHKPLYSTTFSLKIGHAVLFTHLKNYFATVFFVFSFQQNKQYLNRPNFSKSDMSKKKKKWKPLIRAYLVWWEEKKRKKIKDIGAGVRSTERYMWLSFPWSSVTQKLLEIFRIITIKLKT